MKRRLLVECRKTDHSIVVTESVASPSLCLCQGSRWTFWDWPFYCCYRVSGVAVSLLVSGLTMDILSTFCGVFIVQCVKLMLRIFEFGVLLFNCFVYRQSVTCLQRFTRYGHYIGDWGEVEDVIIAFSFSLMTLSKKQLALFFCVHTVVGRHYVR